MGLLDAVFSTRVAQNGAELLTRKVLNFVGTSVSIADDRKNKRTNVTIDAIAPNGHAATSVIGRAASSDGLAADILAAADDRVLARAGGLLAFLQVATGMLADLAVTTAKLADLAVTDAKLAANAVTTAKLADLAVTYAKLAADVTDMQYVSTSVSRALAADAYGKTLLVTSSGGARVITFPKDSTLAIPTGRSGYIRWVAGANQVSVAAEDGSVSILSSGSELKLARLGDQLYWEKTGANAYYVAGPKIP